MATINRFEDMNSWILARQLCKILGGIFDSKGFRKNFPLINQLERSSGSIMDNIAEGFERGSSKEFINFLGYAKGSCGEVRSQLYRAFDRNYLTKEEFEILHKLCLRIAIMIQRFIQYLNTTTIVGLRKK